MKNIKSVVKSVAHGDLDQLREAAGTKLAHAQTAVRQRIAGAVAGSDAVDEAMMRQHKRLLALQASYDQVIAALKHQAERGRKNGKTLKEFEAFREGFFSRLDADLLVEGNVPESSARATLYDDRRFDPAKMSEKSRTSDVGRNSVSKV